MCTNYSMHSTNTVQILTTVLCTLRSGLTTLPVPAMVAWWFEVLLCLKNHKNMRKTLMVFWTQQKSKASSARKRVSIYSAKSESDDSVR